jgi:hypothetical protein
MNHPPIFFVGCELGNFFNKEALIKALLEKNLPKEFSHIRELKDVKELTFQSILSTSSSSVTMSSVSSSSNSPNSRLSPIRQDDFCGHDMDDHRRQRGRSASEKRGKAGRKRERESLKEIDSIPDSHKDKKATKSSVNDDDHTTDNNNNQTAADFSSLDTDSDTDFSPFALPVSPSNEIPMVPISLPPVLSPVSIDSFLCTLIHDIHFQEIALLAAIHGADIHMLYSLYESYSMMMMVYPQNHNHNRDTNHIITTLNMMLLTSLCSEVASNNNNTASMLHATLYSQLLAHAETLLPLVSQNIHTHELLYGNHQLDDDYYP